MNNKAIHLPASKSILNRILLINSLNLCKPLRIYCGGVCDDILEMMEFKKVLGYKITMRGEEMNITPSRMLPPKIKLHIENSGTALRFIICRLAMMDKTESILTVGKHLWTRPHQPLIELLQTMGARISLLDQGFHIIGKHPVGDKFRVDSSSSSQFVSALLLNAPLYKLDTYIIPKHIVSSSYIRLTRQIMKEWGIEIEQRDDGYYIPAGQSYSVPNEYRVENDVSSACYWWALGLISSNPICVAGVSINSIQPDIEFLDILANMGAEIHTNRNGICVGRKGNLKAVSVNMNSLPDQVPTLAIIALFAQGTTKISGISHLRYKESDRINSLCTELDRLGAQVNYNNGVLSIKQLAKLPPERVLDSHGDHRIAMVLSLLTVIFPQLKVVNRDVVKKSHPEFFRNLENLR